MEILGTGLGIVRPTPLRHRAPASRARQPWHVRCASTRAIARRLLGPRSARTCQPLRHASLRNMPGSVRLDFYPATRNLRELVTRDVDLLTSRGSMHAAGGLLLTI